MTSALHRYQSRQNLPLHIRALIGLSDFLRGTWPYMVTLIFGATVAVRMALRHATLKRRWHVLLLRMPGLGSLIRGVNTSRFASALAILVGGGVPLLSALQSGARVMTNVVIREAVEHAIGRVRWVSRGCFHHCWCTWLQVVK